MSNKLFVGNLSFNTTETDLQSLFGAHGTVTETNLMMDRETGRPRGFGFITMNSADEAQKSREPHFKVGELYETEGRVAGVLGERAVIALHRTGVEGGQADPSSLERFEVAPSDAPTLATRETRPGKGTPVKAKGC